MLNVHANLVQMTKMLENLGRWLDKGAEYAKSKNFDTAVLVEMRLAPDMFALRQQVQAAADGVKFLAARLSGKEPPKHPDTEQTYDELRARVRTVVEYVAGFKPSDFDGADARIVPLGFLPGKGLGAQDFLLEMNLPNTYFHLCMAYAILRHAGVPLGKTDYIGSLNLRDA
jgi:uncharacterized protein